MVPVLFALVFGHSQNPYSAKPFPNVFSSTLVSWACGSRGSHGLHGQLTVMAVSASVGLGKSIITFGGSGSKFCVASWLRRAAKTGENIR